MSALRLALSLSGAVMLFGIYALPSFSAQGDSPPLMDLVKDLQDGDINTTVRLPTENAYIYAAAWTLSDEIINVCGPVFPRNFIGERDFMKTALDTYHAFHDVSYLRETVERGKIPAILTPYASLTNYMTITTVARDYAEQLLDNERPLLHAYLASCDTPNSKRLIHNIAELLTLGRLAPKDGNRDGDLFEERVVDDEWLFCSYGIDGDDYNYKRQMFLYSSPLTMTKYLSGYYRLMSNNDEYVRSRGSMENWGFPRYKCPAHPDTTFHQDEMVGRPRPPVSQDILAALPAQHAHRVAEYYLNHYLPNLSGEYVPQLNIDEALWGKIYDEIVAFESIVLTEDETLEVNAKVDSFIAEERRARRNVMGKDYYEYKFILQAMLEKYRESGGRLTPDEADEALQDRRIMTVYARNNDAEQMRQSLTRLSYLTDSVSARDKGLRSYFIDRQQVLRELSRRGDG